MKPSRNAILISILVLAFAIVFLVDFVFNDTPEFFSRGYELGQVLSNLSLSFMASYIFYLVVVVAKENKDRENILSTVYGLTNQLASRAYHIYLDIASAAGETSGLANRKTISRADYKKLCAKANPKDTATNILITRADGLMYQPTYAGSILSNAYFNVKALSENIFVYMPYLDTEQVRIMNLILNSTFFVVATGVLSPTVTNEDFTAFEDQFYDYLLLIRELDEYNEEYNARYKK